MLSGKILIIEDAEALRNDVIEMLRFEGYEVYGAENGRVGVDLAKQQIPDLILCDIMMPELDGYQVFEALRQDATTASIPFVFLTAKTERTDVRHGMGLGADDYLPKPFVATELLETIEARLEKSRSLQTLVEKRIRELSDNIMTALPHELRTPLNTIIGFSDMMIMEAGRLEPDQVVDWAEHINSAAQRLYRLVENYLLYVRAEVIARNEEERRAHQASVVTHVNALVEFQAMHKADVANRAADLKLDFAGENVSLYITDYDLTKIVEEIIDNAVKFSEAGTPIELKTTAPSPDMYVISIKDYGRGMTTEQIQSVGAYMQFERWFYEQQGSGLGLAIAQRLLHIYNGQLTIESEHGAWTQITIRLRRAPA